jgi:hypothetical protein
MNDTMPKAGLAVICKKDGPEAVAMRTHLQTTGTTGAEWFASRDADEVDKRVGQGSIRRVVLPDWGVLLRAIWDEDIHYDRWLSTGTEVSFVSPPAPGSAATAVFEIWSGWNRSRRRRQTVAGAILSVIALAAGFALALLMR